MVYGVGFSGEFDVCGGCEDGCEECVPWVCPHGVSGGCRPCVDADGPVWMRRWDPAPLSGIRP